MDQFQSKKFFWAVILPTPLLQICLSSLRLMLANPSALHIAYFVIQVVCQVAVVVCFLIDRHMEKKSK